MDRLSLDHRWEPCAQHRSGFPAGGETTCLTIVRTMGVIRGPTTGTIGYGGSNGSPVSEFDCWAWPFGHQQPPRDISVCQDADPTGGSSCPEPVDYKLPGGTAPCPCSGSPPGEIAIRFLGQSNGAGGHDLGPGDAVGIHMLQIHTVNSASASCSGTTEDASLVPMFFTTGTITLTVEDPTDPASSCASCGPLSSTVSGDAESFRGLALNTNDADPMSSVFMTGGDLAGAVTGGGFLGTCAPTEASSVSAIKIKCE